MTWIPCGWLRIIGIIRLLIDLFLFTESRISQLQKSRDNLVSQAGQHIITKAAGFRRPLSTLFHCISCDRPIHLDGAGNAISTHYKKYKGASNVGQVSAVCFINRITSKNILLLLPLLPNFLLLLLLILFHLGLIYLLLLFPFLLFSSSNLSSCFSSSSSSSHYSSPSFSNSFSLLFSLFSLS